MTNSTPVSCVKLTVDDRKTKSDAFVRSVAASYSMKKYAVFAHGRDRTLAWGKYVCIFMLKWFGMHCMACLRCIYASAREWQTCLLHIAARFCSAFSRIFSLFACWPVRSHTVHFLCGSTMPASRRHRCTLRSGAVAPSKCIDFCHHIEMTPPTPAWVWASIIAGDAIHYLITRLMGW